MKAIQITCGKIIEIILFAVLLILPFSYNEMTSKWNGLLVTVVVACLFLLVSGRIKTVNQKALGVIFAVLFLIIFDFSEQVNFIHQFNIPVELTWRIPLSTVLLAVGVLAILIKALVDGKLGIINHPFARYFLFACILLVVLMVIFYPFLYSHYQMQSGPDIQLLNKIFKYLMIFLLTMNYLSDEKKFKKMNLGVILSINLTVILSILL